MNKYTKLKFGKFKIGNLVQVNQYTYSISADSERFRGNIGVVYETKIFSSFPPGYGRGNPPTLYYVKFFDGQQSCSGLWTSELIIPNEGVIRSLALTKLDEIIYGIV